MREIAWPVNTKFVYLPPQKIKYLILHHSASPFNITAEDIHEWHKSRTDNIYSDWLGIGYHYVIEADGEIVRGRPETAVGAHCLGFNEFSLGICVVGNFEQTTPKEIQTESLIKLLTGLKHKYPNVEIYGHKYFVKTTCPGRNFPIDKIVNVVDNYYKVSPHFAEAVELARSKGLSTPPDGWDYTQPLTEERFWTFMQRILRW